MRVTVCELHNEPAGLERDWVALQSHVKAERSDLVLLPEMPFYPWLAARSTRDDQAWQAAVQTHTHWLGRLHDLSPAAVLGTRPVVRGTNRLNESFLWCESTGLRAAHAKYYLPDEHGFWEASWYQRGGKTFDTIDFKVASSAGPQVTIGFLICTEIWFTEHARHYGQQGAHVIACPRATPVYSSDKWIAAGRVAAVVSGAYGISSNFRDHGQHEPRWAGCGWIIHPQEGDVIGVTSAEEPFLTVELDLQEAVSAKQTYPRYVPE